MFKHFSFEQRANKQGKSMKKLFKVSGLLCVALAFLVGLSSCSQDRSMDVVAEVNGKSIYRWELDKLYEGSIEEYEANLQLDLSNPKNANKRKEYRETLLDTLIDDVYITEAAKLDGYDLTAEENAAFEKEFEETIEKNIQALMKDYEGDSNAREKAEKAYEELLEERHLSIDFLKSTGYDSKVREKLSKKLFESITPTDDELKENYEQMVEIQEDIYKDDPEKYTEQYFKSAQNPEDYTVIYNPAGFKRVKQIMIYFPEEIDQKIKDLTVKQTEALMQQKEVKETKGENDPAFADLANQLEAMRIEEAQLYIQAHEGIADKVDLVEKELDEGKDFEEVLKEYGEDEDMKSGPISDTGYLVGKGSGLLPELIDAADELEKVGDVSKRVRTVNGYHFLKVTEVIEEGPVGFERAKQFVSDLMTQTPRATTLDEYLEVKKGEQQDDDNQFEVKIHKQNIG